MFIWCISMAAHLQVMRCIEDGYKLYLILSLCLSAIFILCLIVGLFLALKFYDVVHQGKKQQQLGFD